LKHGDSSEVPCTIFLERTQVFEIDAHSITKSINTVPSNQNNGNL